LWGHGYVERYFGELSERIPLKRWRCPDCCAVHTVRPDNYWRGMAELAARNGIAMLNQDKPETCLNPEIFGR